MSYIKDYVKQNSGKILTILSIKKYFDSTRQEEDKITLYRIRKTMKVEMRYIFKKASIVNKVMHLSDRKRRFFESAMIQLYIHEANEEVIFLDEASCSQRDWKVLYLEQKGIKAYIVSAFDNLTISMWFAFSILRFYGVIVTSNTFNSTKFLLFLKQLIYQRQTYHKDLNSNFSLICDNS